ncbi:hypothetical protein AAFN88_09955 [Pelagibius sp. CAU 1746]|uniref:hypothetical protein n=1 Tax=Pelagibius sp. CAU 1746 TaxID=3140370 RepID=UPI00325AD097
MAIVSRSVFLGAAIFAGAAVIAVLAAMVLHGIPHSGRSFSEALAIRLTFSLAAGIAAAISYVVVWSFGWRLRCEPLLGRALVAGCSTVVIEHLLIGGSYGFLLLIVNIVLPNPPFWARGLNFSVLGMGILVAAYGWYLTLPLGIAAAAIVEWLERRREAAAAKAAG